MKLLLSLLFALPLIAQTIIPVIGDTTDLKANESSGIVILEEFGSGDHTGGGLFRRIDSTYAEGINAFDYAKSDGLQWARLQYIGGELGAFTDLTSTSLVVSGTATVDSVANTGGFTAADHGYSFSTSVGVAMYLNASNVLAFTTANSDRLYIDAAGRVDVGASSQVTSMFSVKNSTKQVNLTLWENEDGTQKAVLDSTGGLMLGTFLQLPLHTVIAGDSILGRVFLDAADTVLKAGSGTDLIVIKDLAP